jgi:hypothetical protein
MLEKYFFHSLRFRLIIPLTNSAIRRPFRSWRTPTTLKTVSSIWGRASARTSSICGACSSARTDCSSRFCSCSLVHIFPLDWHRIISCNLRLSFRHPRAILACVREPAKLDVSASTSPSTARRSCASAVLLIVHQSVKWVRNVLCRGSLGGETCGSLPTRNLRDRGRRTLCNVLFSGALNTPA